MNVILSGGHYLGVVLHCAALAELHRQCRDRGETITNVGGLSAGALVAAAYCSGRTIGPDGLVDVISTHLLSTGSARGGKPIAEPDYAGFAAAVLSPEPGTWPSVYKTNRIRKTVGDLCALHLGGMRTRFRCVLSNMTNRGATEPIATVIDSERHGDLSTRDVVTASMAIPLAFPLVEYGGDVFGDGALAVGNTPYDLWADIDPTGEDTVILRITRPPQRKRPSFRPIGLAEDTIETLLAGMDRLSRQSMPPQARVIDLPAFGPGAAFEMTAGEALEHIGRAESAVSRLRRQKNPQPK